MRRSDNYNERCNMKKPVYLDYNGTTPHDPQVAVVMRHFLENDFGNPSSNHWYGNKPRQSVDKARRQVADLLNCSPEEIIFTSGGTESNNHAIKGSALKNENHGGHIITSNIEHPAVLEVCRYLERFGYDTTFLPVDRYGMVDPESVDAAIRPDTCLITIMHSNNEVGTIQPIEAISAISRIYGIALHTDACQSVGKVDIDVKALDIDLLSLAGHKLYGPKGVGSLYIKKGFRIEKYCHGASQERGARGGTENVLEVAGMGEACAVSAKNMQQNVNHMIALRDKLHNDLKKKLGDLIVLNGHSEQRLPNTLSLSFKGLKAQSLLHAVRFDVAASAGAACHSDRVEISHVLAAMGVSDSDAEGTLRFSVGRMTTPGEIDRVVIALEKGVCSLL